MTTKRLTLIILPAILLLLNCGKAEREHLVFGFIPSSKIEEIEIAADSLTTILTQESGIPFKAFVAPDYASLIEAMRTGHVDIAWLAPLSYVEANKIAGATAVLTSVRQGKPYYYSAIFTSNRSGIRSIDDLKGKVIGFTDPTSTAGRLFPEMELIQMGIDPASFFREIRYLGGHDRVVRAVYDGLVDAGASFANDTLNNDNAWHQFLKSDGEVQSIRPLLFSRPIPGDVVAVTGKSRKARLETERIKSALIAISATKTGKRLFGKLNRTDELVPADLELYENVRKAVDLVLGH